MKTFILRIHHILQPIINIFAIKDSISNLKNYLFFFIDLYKYKKYSNEKILLYPQLNDKTHSSQSGGGEYFYQDTYVVKKVLDNKTKHHVDIGSRIDGFAGFLSCFITIEYVDIRKPNYNLKNFIEIEGSILNLPYEDSSIKSLSSLHVVEHIGLGRYGDSLDFNGSIKAIKELSRVLQKNGKLYFSVPCGVSRVEFNAHRVFDPVYIVSEFKKHNVVLDSFNVFDKHIVENVKPSNYSNSNYVLGIFIFTK